MGGGWTDNLFQAYIALLVSTSKLAPGKISLNPKKIISNPRKDVLSFILADLSNPFFRKLFGFAYKIIIVTYLSSPSTMYLCKIRNNEVCLLHF